MIEILTNIVQHWQQYLALCTGATIVGLVGLLKMKDKKIDQLAAQLFLSQSAQKIAQDDQTGAKDEQAVSQLKKEFEDALSNNTSSTSK